MFEEALVLVGNWGFEPGSRGITIYRYYPEDGHLELRETIFPEIEAGQLCIDEGRKIIYVANEIGSRRGENGGGGYISAYKLDSDTRAIHFFNERETLVPYPAYLYVDKTKSFLLVAHHSDKHYITKIVRKKDGGFTNRVLSSDTLLVLFQIMPDGSIGEICDMFDTGIYGNGRISHQHSIVPGLGENIFFVCDKGLDLIYTFKIDEKNKKLVLLHREPVEKGSMPRYSVAHPYLPLLYVNNEGNEYVNLFQYREDGKIELLTKVSLLYKEAGADSQKIGGTDILLHPNGKTMYVGICGVNRIAVLSILKNGMLRLKQNISCGGVNPRGLCLSPDCRYLYSGNVVSCDITMFCVQEDGSLSPSKLIFPAVSPSVIRFMCCQDAEDGNGI